MTDRLVVKVGGSLYDHPKLKLGLTAWLAARPERHVLIVPGGGDFADAVRKLDTVHGLGEAAAHHLALESLAPAAHFLRTLLGGAPSWTVIDPARFLREYERRHGVTLPRSWALTTDSIAACAAHDASCGLVLLKSIDIPPGMTWAQAAGCGHVDPEFPTQVAKHRLQVTAVNFRCALDAMR